MDQLKQHTAALQEHAGNLMAKLRELETSEQETSDELAEAELRAKVGEIASGEWDGTSRKAQREIAKLRESQDVIVADLNRIREILGVESGESMESDSAPRTSADFDELAFLKSVVGQTTPGSSTPPAAAIAEPPSALKPETKVEQKAEPASAAAPQAAQPAPPGIVKDPSGELTSKKTGVDTPLKVPVQSDNALGVRASGVVEQPKTLKCAECGSMNYPSEWYCERCGAELTVV